MNDAIKLKAAERAAEKTRHELHHECPKCEWLRDIYWLDLTEWEMRRQAIEASKKPGPHYTQGISAMLGDV